MRHRSRLGILKFILLGIIFITALGFIVMTLWNCLIPELFHGPVVTFWQALGLLLLGKLLFGWHGHQHGAAWKANWKEKMRRRMESMTPEERERLRERCRFGRGRTMWDDWDEKKRTEAEGEGKEGL